MKHTLSAFKSDELYLSSWDLIKLFFGKTLRGTGLVIKRGYP